MGIIMADDGYEINVEETSLSPLVAHFLTNFPHTIIISLNIGTFQKKIGGKKMTFTVMTWNVENFFTPGPMSGSKKVIKQPEYEEKLAYISGKLLEIKPDIVALQELGWREKATTQSLDDLQACMGDQYPYSARSKYPDKRGIYVGFLSRLKILSDTDDETNHAYNFPAGSELSQVPDWKGNHLVHMGRGAVKIDVEPVSGCSVRLVTCHLKSKLITYPTDSGSVRYDPDDENERTVGESLALFRRTAEAGTVRTFINRLMEEQPDMHTIVLGDFNDEPRAATTQQILGPADRDVTTDDKLDKVRLYNLVDSIPCKGSKEKVFLDPKKSFSRIYNDRRELIDHILISKTLLGKTSDLKQGKWQVQQVSCLVDDIISIGDNPGKRIGDPVPDHAPVMAVFDLS